MVRYKSYIICTSPRSGSTLLCRLLAATRISGRPDSHFHQPSVADWASNYDISPSDYSNERALLTAVFRAAIARGTGSTGIFGLRLQRGSFDYFMQKLNILCTDCSSDSDVARIQKTFGKTLFIHLTRENKLDQAVSLEKAIQTGLWHLAPDGTEIERTSAPRDPVYDADAISNHLVELTAMEQQWHGWFAQQGLEPLRIRYRDLSANPTKTLAEVLDHLGLDSTIAQGMSVPVAQLANATNKSWVKRFLHENETCKR